MSKCLLKALRRRWPSGSYARKFRTSTLTFVSREWLLNARRAYSEDGWFIERCSSRGEEHVLRALKNIPVGK